MYTARELYEKIEKLYGESRLWISELSNECKIPYYYTRQLTVAAGYHYHKKIYPVTLDEFKEKPCVKNAIKKMNDMNSQNLEK